MNPRLHGLDPASIKHIMAAGDALDSGRLDQAEQQIAQVPDAYQCHAEVLRMRAGIYSLRGMHRDALSSMRGALAQRPQDPLYQNTLGSLLGAAGDYEAAIEVLRLACAMQPKLAIAWYNLGVMLTKSVRNDEAMDALQHAVLLAPDHRAARALLADMLRTRGDVAEAAKEYRKLISQFPADGVAWWGLADLKTAQFTRDDIQVMQSVFHSEEVGEDDRIAVGFALAKALDDEKQYDDSLDMLEKSNAIALRRKTWNAEAFSKSVAHISSAFDPAPIGAKEALGRGVIFIVSLPRAGSTLVEQILASHSSIEGAGELPDLPYVLAEESLIRGRSFPYWVADVQSNDWERLGRRYLERTAHWRVNSPIATDKLPNNWIYIGAIRAMLPAARIVVCHRDPLETCFSCYRQRLDSNSDYSRTFQDLASFWIDFDRAVKRSVELHSEYIYEHRYEALLDDPEARIRELLNFCGLPYEDACLQFNQTRREVRSPSATQVRQPLNRGTARAPRYGKLLDPLRKELGLSPWQL